MSCAKEGSTESKEAADKSIEDIRLVAMEGTEGVYRRQREKVLAKVHERRPEMKRDNDWEDYESRDFPTGLVEREIASAISEGRRPRVLEFGAGEGKAAEALKEKYGDAIEVTVIDLELPETLPDVDKALEGDIQTVELPSRYDVIYSSQALQYVADKLEALRRLAGSLSAVF
jgi:SAM-dependent methyltransferase